MKLISICFISCLMIGCSNVQPQVIYKTEYQEVKVPVMYDLTRPKRPKFTASDTAPAYLLKMRVYARTLEIIIDEHNKKD